MNKGRKILTIISIVFFSLGIVFDIIGFIQLSTEKDGTLMITLGSIFDSVGLILLVLAPIIYGFGPMPIQKPIVVVKTVDVKPVPETREQQLYKQYVELHKEGLISDEDLEKKRIELLGK